MTPEQGLWLRSIEADKVCGILPKQFNPFEMLPDIIESKNRNFYCALPIIMKRKNQNLSLSISFFYL